MVGVTDGGVNIVLRGYGFGVNYPEATLQGEEGGEEERNNLLLVVCGVWCVVCGVVMCANTTPSTLQVRFGNLPLLDVTSSQAGVSATGTKQGTSRRILA